MNKSAYSASLLPVLSQNLLDLLSGHSARAHARMGRVKPPQGQGKLLWIRAGASFQSQKIAAQLAGAIRGKRQDIRIVLTYEDEQIEAFRYELDGLAKIGIGYGPCDRPAAIKRFLSRMQPFAVLLTGDSPGSNLLNILQSNTNIHTVLVHTDTLTRCHVEAQYPYWGQQTADFPNVQSGSELMSLLVQNQLEPTLRTVLHGSAAGSGYFWLHAKRSDLQSLIKQWQAHRLSQTYTLIFSVQGKGPFDIENSVVPVKHSVRLSDWDRQSLPSGSLVWLDSWAWVGAVAVASIGNWIQLPNRWIYWQAVAASQPVMTAFTPFAPGASDDLIMADFQQILSTWEQWQDTSVSTRALTDRCRRVYWEARRQSMVTLESLLQRVYDW